ncbi:helix-turn-helix domain-containing protein, partial [Streptomyces calidiresistens]|uniref:helix-turn-helix domain-containing protein n=1 Tax=Streptomyces calidiresistens TaxID=1485586 RepID=UPI00225DF106
MMVYLESGQNARATASRLALTERTVANRLQAARTLLPPGTDLSSLELALALRLMPLVKGGGRA